MFIEEQARDYQPWLDNARHLREITARLEQLAIQQVETTHDHAERVRNPRVFVDLGLLRCLQAPKESKTSDVWALQY